MAKKKIEQLRGALSFRVLHHSAVFGCDVNARNCGFPEVFFSPHPITQSRFVNHPRVKTFQPRTPRRVVELSRGTTDRVSGARARNARWTPFVHRRTWWSWPSFLLGRAVVFVRVAKRPSFSRKFPFFV